MDALRGPSTWLRRGAMLLALAAGGCADERPPERPARDVMQGAPVFLPSRFVTRRGSAEALEHVFRSSIATDSIATWYRWVLADRGYRIVGDVQTADGGVTMHVEREGPPLWIIIRPHPSGTGTEYSLIGALPDSLAREP